MLLDHIVAEARTLVDAKHAGDAAYNSANGTADDCTHRPRGPLTFASSPLDAARDALRDGRSWKHQCDGNCGSSDNATDHKISSDRECCGGGKSGPVHSFREFLPAKCV
jgi:hypothetical protein